LALRKRLLIWNDGALGDLLISLGALSRIHSCQPTAAIHFLGRPPQAHLLRQIGFIAEVYSSDTGQLAALFSEESQDDSWHRRFIGYDALYLFRTAAPASITARLARLIPAIHHILPFPAADQHTTAAEHQLNQVAASGGEALSSEPAVESLWRPDAEADRFGQELLAGGALVIAIHPGSGGRKKCWPAANFAALADRLLAAPQLPAAIVMIITGPAEAERSWQWRSHPRLLCIAGRPLVQVAALLRRSHLFVGNDGGITHLAASLGTPTIALFGPTDPRIWAPAKHAQVLRSGADCAPCTKEKMIVCEKYRCFEGLTVDAVFERIIGYKFAHRDGTISNVIGSSS